MVEGPGCKVKSETLEKNVLNQKVCKIVNPLLETTYTKTSDLKGLRVIDIKVLGKELFMVFENDICIRFHFLMNGSIRYNYKKQAVVELPITSSRGPKSLTLSIEFEKLTVNVYDSSFHVRSALDCIEKWHRMKTLDVCSTSFCRERAVAVLRDAKHSSRMVCDVIMDQEVAPGLGNIIKNEALFDSGINPVTSMLNLSDDLLNFLVVAYVEYSKIFYQMRKSCRPLQPHMRIYNKQNCTACGSVLTKCKPGEYKRPTWFCNQCQQNRLGVVPPRRAPSESASRKRKYEGSNDLSSKSKKITDFFGSSKMEALVSAPMPRAPSIYKYDSDEDVAPKEKVVVSFSPKTGCLSKAGPPSTSSTNDLKPKRPSAPCCSHGLPCKENRVVKDGENKNRLFFSCEHSRQQQCKFFQWADSDFPKCKHSVVSTRRTVLKLNENNGKEFFCCRLEKGSQCDFFEWCH